MVSKLAWEIRWTFIKALKNLKICNLMSPFCPKHNASARKFQRNYVSWYWRLMQNLSENWFVARKMTRNLVNFHASSWKSEDLHLMGSFCRKHKKSSMKQCRKKNLKVWKKMQSLKKKTGSWFQKFGKKLTNLVNCNAKQWQVWKFALWCATFVNSI